MWKNRAECLGAEVYSRNLSGKWTVGSSSKKGKDILKTKARSINLIIVRSRDHAEPTYQDPPCTLSWGYMVPNSRYLGPNRGQEEGLGSLGVVLAKASANSFRLLVPDVTVPWWPRSIRKRSGNGTNQLDHDQIQISS